ncbi:MAG: BON domain-containing protein [Planctomycetes bacterium]|nr:BON domain-containing protein [Planctomycetota bacterium]
MRAVFLVLLAASLVPAYAGAAETTADKSTAREISSHIQQSGQLRNYRIGVTYQNGVASLAGTVTSQEQRDAAIRLTKEIKGVKRVECRLQCTETADEMPTIETPAANNQFELTNESAKANGNAIAASAQGAPADRVVQAYGEQGRIAAPMQQRPTMLAGNNPMMRRPQAMRRGNMPLPAPRPGMDPAIRQASAQACYPAGGPYAEGYGGMAPGMAGPGMGGGMGPLPAGVVPTSYGRGPSYENAQMPGYAWPSYASYPNYAALSYPQQYSPTAWPYIGPFYPYPQVPLAWRKVSLEWDDGWWFLDFSAHNSSH